MARVMEPSYALGYIFAFTGCMPYIPEICTKEDILAGMLDANVDLDRLVDSGSDFWKKWKENRFKREGDYIG